MDKMREEFEAWYWAKLHGDRNVSLRRVIFNKTSDGSYRGLKCNTSWKAWKASRVALCVELPYSLGYPNNDMVYLSDVEERLEKAGVSYK